MLTWGIAPGLEWSRNRALKAHFSGTGNESRFQRWCLGNHKSPGRCPRPAVNAAPLGAKHINDLSRSAISGPVGVAGPSKNVRNRLQETRDSLFSYSMRANRFLFLVGTVAGLGLSGLPAVETCAGNSKETCLY